MRASGVGGEWPVQVISLPRPVRSEYPTEGAEAPSAEMLDGVGGSRGQVTGREPLAQMPPARPRIGRYHKMICFDGVGETIDRAGRR